VLQNSPRLSVSDVPSLRVVESRSAGRDQPFAIGHCMLIWAGLVAATWSGVALVVHLI
jgi:hypothetical protein